MPNKLVSSLVTQLCRHLQRLPQGLKYLYTRNNNGGHQPTFKDLISVFKEMLDMFTQAYIVLDALDECMEWSLLSKFLTSVSNKHRSLCLLITSREEQYIENDLLSLNVVQVNLKIQAVDKDIRSYVTQIVKEEKCFHKWGNSGIQLIIDKLTEGANGM